MVDVLWAAVTVVDGTKGFLSTIYLQFIASGREDT
jgi:hypothetical protein